MSWLGRIKNSEGVTPTIVSHELNKVQYKDIIYLGFVQKMIDDVIINLTNKDLFEQLNYSVDGGNPNLLSNFLLKLFNTQKVQGSMLLKGEEAVAIIEKNDSFKFEDFATLNKKDFEIQCDSLPLSTALQSLACNLSNIINTNSDAIMLEKALIFKLSSLRDSASMDTKGNIANQIGESLDAIKNQKSSFIFMDEKDSVSTLGSQLGQASKVQYDNVIAQLVLLTGYSDSFFTGQFNHQLGGTLEGQELADSNARKRFFKNYLQGFFSLISPNIQIENKLTSLISADKLLELASFDDIVDKKAIYEKLGIPLKNTAKE